MDMRRTALSAIIIIMVLASLINPVSAGDSSKNNSTDKQTYIVVFQDAKKDKKIGETADVSDDPLPGKQKYQYKVINAQAVELTVDQLAVVKARKDVKYVVPDEQVYADLNDVVKWTNTTSAWSLGYTGRGVNVSVIDSGIDATHTDLAGKVILWKDYLNNTTQPYDDWGHGTHVAGIIAGSGAASNGLYKGLANGVNLFGVKILNSTGVANLSDLMAAIDWSVQNQADVISISLSMTNHSDVLDLAVHNAVASGVVVVCSAGNTGPKPGSIKCPADSPDAIAVGSIDARNKTSTFSSRGPTRDGHIKPDIVTYGEGIISDRATGTLLGNPVGQKYVSMSGTSMTCPQVSAACAILLEADSSLTPVDLKNVLISTTTRLDTTYPNNITGWGILNVGAALNQVLSSRTTIAKFTADTTSGSTPLTVHFTDQSTNDPTSWDWNYGDSTTHGATQNSTHQYTAAGNYTVTLTVTNAYGTDNETKTGYITVRDPTPPIAEFTADTISGTAPLTVHFTDQSANDPTEWSWDFGDGATSTLPSPTHQYNAAGTYTVNLTVTNSGGSNTTSKKEYINATPPWLIAAFVSDKSGGDYPLTVQFTDKSTGAPAPSSWDWDFGDGSAHASTQNPTYTYMVAGNYTVTLTVTNAYVTDPETGYVRVMEPKPPIAEFTADTISGSAPLTVHFTDQSANDPTSWDWNYGDSTTHGATQNPTHQYTVAGNYTVTLTVTNAAGTDSKPKTGYISVTAPQVTWKTYISNTGGSTVSVINQSTDTVTATITTGTSPYGIAFSPDGTRAYVAVESQNKVMVISTATDTIVNNITVGSKPHGVVMSPDGKRLYVSHYGGQSISVIDTSDTSQYKVIGTITGINNPHELWIHPDGNRLYVSTYQSNNVYVINTTNDVNTIESTITGSKPYFISIDPAGDRLFVANYNSNNIQVYDALSLTLQTTINTAKGPLSPIISPDGSRFYYVTDGDNKLTIAYANNYTVIKTVACGSGVRGIACSPDGSKVYVTNMNGGTTSIVNVTNDAGTVKTVRVGSSPYGMGQFAGYYPVRS